MIRAFSPTGTLLGELDAVASVSWTRRWHKPGEFELRVNRHVKYADTLALGNVVVLQNDPRRAGLIVHREIELGEEGKGGEVWRVRGVSLAGVLGRRITVPPAGQAYDAVSGPAETVMKHYVSTQAVNPTDTARAISQLAVASDLGRGPTLSWQSRYKGLAEELEAISVASGLGWDVWLQFSPWAWLFEVYEGRDLTAGQSTNPPVIFSPDFDAIRSQRYAESEANYRNVAYVGGQGEGVDRVVVTVGNASGLGRLEVFVDARDLAEQAALQARGEQHLAELHVDRLFEAEILPHRPFRYREDWDLGDVVTIQNKAWGVTMDARVVAVREIHEPSGFRLEVEFGTGWPTLLSELRREIRQFGLELRR